jgi:hypothetical protein
LGKKTLVSGTNQNEPMVDSETGEDGIWFLDAAMNTTKFNQNFKTEIYVAYHIETRFGGIGFQSGRVLEEDNPKRRNGGPV